MQTQKNQVDDLHFWQLTVPGDLMACNLMRHSRTLERSGYDELGAATWRENTTRLKEYAAPIAEIESMPRTYLIISYRQ
jgi:hypothetical protein